MNRFAATLAGICVFAASAFAAKECLQTTGPFPGVDEAGNLDDGNSGDLQCKECINPKNGKFTQKCSGNVPNESGDNQKYKDPPGLLDNLDRVLYKVKASGKAKLTAKGVVELPE